MSREWSDGVARRGPRTVLGALRHRGLIPDALNTKIASLLGIAVALSAAPASANPPPRRPGRSPLPPWSRTIGHPPPRPLAPAGGAHPWKREEGVALEPPPDAQEILVPIEPEAGNAVGPDDEATHEAPAEPPDPAPPIYAGESHALHAPRPGRGERLFPRAIGDPRRDRAMRAHPAGKNAKEAPPTAGAEQVSPSSPNPPSPPGSSSGNGAILAEAVAAAGAARDGERYTVRPGDSLWDIAEMKLGTAETRRIARYWPRIHRANRDVIGGDPNLIVPGQVLILPPERP